MPGETLRMLVVDRSADLVMALRTLSAKLGVEMVCCDSMSDGFAELLRSRPHIAIIDATMCDLGGIGLARGARALSPECEVILTSVDPASDIGLEAIRAGALECVTPQETLIRVRVHLSRLRARMEQRDSALSVQV
jgi:DNA-binding response OmpR family regulator